MTDSSTEASRSRGSTEKIIFMVLAGIKNSVFVSCG
jgi:hypothetical protein